MKHSLSAIYSGPARESTRLRSGEDDIMPLFLSRLESPLGELRLITDTERTIRALDFATHPARMHRSVREHYGNDALADAPAPDEIAQAIARYFSGEISAIDSLVTATVGSDLQRTVWAALCCIPAGTTTTYGKLAKELGLDDPPRGHRRRCGHRCQSHRDHRTVSSRDRQQRRTEGICLGLKPKALAPRA